MAKKFYTVIIVPHAKAKFRKVKVPYNGLIGLCVLALGLVVSLGYLGWRFVKVHNNSQEFVRVLQENYILRQENERTREVTGSLRAQMDGFQETVGQFKIMFGINSEADSGVGEMGASEVPLDDPDRKYTAFSYLSQLKSEADALHSELANFNTQVSEKSVVWEHTPSIRPVRNGFISSRFGMRTDPFTGKRVFHSAVDISSWYWEEIVAPAAGIVTRADKSRSSGLFVEISHGYGYTTLYAHLKKINVKPGQTVSRRDIIGYVGNTGRSTGPHLHYEVRYQGKPINPLKFMADREGFR